MLVFEYLWIFLLLPLPWLLRTILPARPSNQAAVRVPFGNRLAGAMSHKGDSSSPPSPARRLILPSLLWLLVLGALARPQWLEPPITQELPTRDLLLLVDLSSSMKQKDFTNQAGVQVDRLSAVKEVLGEFLQRREGDRVGLVVFGDAAYLQAPFSTDLQLSRRLLDECEVGMAGPRTAFGDAIGLGVNLFSESEAPAKTIIALTDGNDTKSQVPSVEAARVAARREIRIHTVAIGDPTTAGEDKLDQQALREVAAETGGSYFFAADRASLAGIYDQLDEIETRKIKMVSHRPRRDLFYLPLAIALILSLATTLYEAIARRKITATLRKKQVIGVNPITGKLEIET
ncbi:VWA domain-containing protein [Nitrosococcus watsonii]|uniref:von Willebrand factor type A n=1 Tax=Nitrosococcus watsoni (strain C-113) TaxID=105559 RepID=D8K4B4_NITWC|nr:VWA domain-containing protein [Nitrosococcus watsonii]ADJ27811.1 von Willebrand factor type A [Nitrosococcus watsonii C-113]